MKTAKKPIYPVLPSVITAGSEVAEFLSMRRINFPDETILGNVLCRVYNTPPLVEAEIDLPLIDTDTIRKVISKNSGGYLQPDNVQKLLDAAGYFQAEKKVLKSAGRAVKTADLLGFPVVIKVVAPVHKSDVVGVVLNVKDGDSVRKEFNRMIHLKDTTAILIQPILSRIELFAGAKFEPGFSHMVLCGMGGIVIEVLKDIQTGLAPLTIEETISMILNLKGYQIIKGVRGQKGVNEKMFAGIIVRLSALVTAALEITEIRPQSIAVLCRKSCGCRCKNRNCEIVDLYQT